VGEGDCDQGTALLLVPTAVVIVLVAAALAFDAALALQAKRALLHAASGAANEAVSLGVDEAALHRTGMLCLDPARVTDALGAALADRSEVDLRAEIGPSECPRSVRVDLTAPGPRPFLRLIPPGRPTTVLRAQATAHLAER